VLQISDLHQHQWSVIFDW